MRTSYRSCLHSLWRASARKHVDMSGTENVQGRLGAAKCTRLVRIRVILPLHLSPDESVRGKLRSSSATCEKTRSARESSPGGSASDSDEDGLCRTSLLHLTDFLAHLILFSFLFFLSRLKATVPLRVCANEFSERAKCSSGNTPISRQ